MRICDLNTGLIKLKRSLRKLNERWDNAQPYWNDAASAEFSKDHLQPLIPLLTLTVAAVQRLGTMLEQVEKDLEDARPLE